MKVNETHIKGQIKDYLAALSIFNFPLVQGLGAYKGVPDRVMHYRGRVVYLEIKVPGGKMSEHQKTFQAQCVEDKIDYWCVSSTEELEVKLREWE